MIIWLNGAFGSGKTTAAYELQRRLPDSYVYDPENIGYFIRKNTPKSTHLPDFQDYPQWRLFNREMLQLMAQEYKGTLIVPMTVTDPVYFEELTSGAAALGTEIRHLILYASKEVLHRRLNKRMERGQTWAKAQIDRCQHAFDEVLTGEKIMTDTLSVQEVVEEVARRSGLHLRPDNRSRLRRSIDRLLVQIKHIRG
ncbi:AAA family ATPase [Paenibacillus sp. 1P07SE]|uniref:AAA family ATPase n=1 Tax=Paenibacillus sp. 1P07SE TaxID=3132209 RepID=UPI0039A4BA7E